MYVDAVGTPQCDVGRLLMYDVFDLVYRLHLSITVISSPLKFNCQDISKPISIP
jgi:hypothetical protein